MSDNVHVIATINVQPGRRADFLAEFWQVVPLVHQEEGCLRYEPTVDVETLLTSQEDPRTDTVVVLETWESLDALEKHLIAPHMQNYRSKVKDLVAGVDLQVLGVASADGEAETEDDSDEEE